MADQALPTSLSLMQPNDVEDLKGTIKERVDQGEQYRRDNFDEEFQEVWRAYKVRTKKIYKRDKAGNATTQEDTSRTNVAMPDINVIVRRNTARLTANAPKINYRGPNQDVADKLTSLAYQQFDRSGELVQHRRIVQGSEIFGFYYSKVTWDDLSLELPMRKPVDKAFQNYSDILKFKGVPDEQISSMIDQAGGDRLDSDTAAMELAKFGDEVSMRQRYVQYEGPVVKAVFPGNLTFDPNADCLNDSYWCNERDERDDLWLKKMRNLKYKDPNTGGYVLAFDPKVCEELINSKPTPIVRDATNDLKKVLRDVTGKNDPNIDRKLRMGKRIMFTVDEHHETEDDGSTWITWIANEKYAIGRMPYQVELCGRFNYTELVPLPDLITAYGDSTPRLLRFLWNMHNATVAQNFDYITALMKIFLLNQGEDLSDDAIIRGNFKELRVKDVRNIMALTIPQLPAGSFEREAQILRMFGLAEPSLNNIDTGTQSNPMAGKLATTALLAAKASDAFTQFKLDAQNLYLKELGEKKLWMNQQLGSQWDISTRYPMSKALTEKYGKVASMPLDVMDIQDFYEVEPEAGSMLAVNDELKRAAAQDLQVAASANPDILDRRKVAQYQLSTIPNIGPVQDFIIPENPNPPTPEAKLNISVSIAYKDLPPDAQAMALSKIMGEPLPEEAVAEIHDKATMQGVESVSKAANAAHDMLSEQPSPEELAAQAKQPKLAGVGA